MSDWFERLAVFDLETTGVDTRTSRIVSAHVGVLDAAGAVIERDDWLADPGVPIPAGAAAVHGISTARARNEGAPAAEVVWQIVQRLRALLAEGVPVTIYNAPYDLSLLHHEARRHGIRPLDGPAPIVDPLVIDKAVDRYRRGKRTLVLTAEHYEVVLEAAHDAGADAIAAGRVAQALVRRFPDELMIDAHDLHGRQQIWYQQQAESFQEYMRRVRDPLFTASVHWPLRVGLAA